MTIVTTTLNPTSTIVKRRYFPNNGSAKEVDGIISDISKKNIVCDSKMLIQRATFSPESAGR
jgi:hypothetical protein